MINHTDRTILTKRRITGSEEKGGSTREGEKAGERKGEGIEIFFLSFLNGWECFPMWSYRWWALERKSCGRVGTGGIMSRIWMQASLRSQWWWPQPHPIPQMWSWHGNMIMAMMLAMVWISTYRHSEHQSFYSVNQFHVFSFRQYQKGKRNGAEAKHSLWKVSSWNTESGDAIFFPCNKEKWNWVCRSVYGFESLMMLCFDDKPSFPSKAFVQDEME